MAFHPTRMHGWLAAQYALYAITAKSWKCFPSKAFAASIVMRKVAVRLIQLHSKEEQAAVGQSGINVLSQRG